MAESPRFPPLQDHIATGTIVRIDRLDDTLIDGVEAQLTTADRRALLALHAAVAATYGTFTYLEIGSFRGGEGVVAFHDTSMIEQRIERFFREAWPGVSLPVAMRGTSLPQRVLGGGGGQL